LKTAKILEFPTQNRRDQLPGFAINRFLPASILDSMQKRREAGVVVAEEIEAIVASGGSGRHGTDPREALSLQVLRETSRSRRTLKDVLHDFTVGEAMNDRWLNPFGFHLLNWGRDVCKIGLSLDQYSKADAIFKRNGIVNWRSLVAHDCAELLIKGEFFPDFSEAWAVFYLGNRKGMKFQDKIVQENGQIWKYGRR
jgi:hypothetical protein